MITPQLFSPTALHFTGTTSSWKLSDARGQILEKVYSKISFLPQYDNKTVAIYPAFNIYFALHCHTILHIFHRARTTKWRSFNCFFDICRHQLPEKFTGYCLNGGVFLRRSTSLQLQNRTVKEVKTSSFRLNICRLQEEQLLSQQVYSKDNQIKIVNYVLAFCHEIKPVGRLDRVRSQINVPEMSWFYKNIKVYLLARVVYEITRLIANNATFASAVMVIRPVRYTHPQIAHCLILTRFQEIIS